MFDLELQNFERNLSEVEKLVHFDRAIHVFVDQYIGSRLSANDLAIGPKLRSENRKAAVQRSLPSLLREELKPTYQTMYNQCVVLYVSHLESFTRNIFRSITRKRIEGRDTPATFEKLKLVAVELLTHEGDIKDLLIDKLASEQSFQSMSEIQKAFWTNFGMGLQFPDLVRNNVAVAQASRHAIVHANAKVDLIFLRDLKSIGEREILRGTPKRDSSIQYSTNDLEIVNSSMREYAKRLVSIAAGTKRKDAR